MNLSQLVIFSFTSTLFLMTPAPDMIPVITRGVGQGRRAALLTVLGYSLGDVTHAFFASAGLSTLLLTSALAFKFVKYAGAIYFLYLGTQILLNKSEFSFDAQQDQLAPRKLIWQGYLSNLLNPEATLFFLAFLPQFINVAESNAASKIMILGLIFTLIAFLVYCLIAYFSGSIGSWLKSKRIIADNLRYFTGSVFILFGVRVALKEKA